MQISPPAAQVCYTLALLALTKTKKSRLTLNPGKTTALFSPVHFNSFLPVVVTQTKMHPAPPLSNFHLVLGPDFLKAFSFLVFLK
jgi:hypothetical protein